MRAALYTRVSTKEQTEGYSLDTQRERLTAWAVRENWELTTTYEDAGFSATNINRPGFQQMLADAEAQRFDLLLARVRERVFRNALDARVYQDRLKKYGVSIRYLDEPNLDGDTPSAFLTDSMFAAYNEYFSRNLSHKVKLGKEARTGQGLSNGRPPIGYNADWTINEKEADLVRWIFNEYATGNVSYTNLCQAVGERVGRRFNQSRIEIILRNPLYAGRLHNGTKSVYPAIVDEPVWYRAAEIREARKGRPVSFRQKKTPYLLSGYGRHATCKNPLWGTFKDRASGLRYYSCSDRRKGGPCRAPLARAERVDESLSSIITSIRLPDDWQEMVKEFSRSEPGTDRDTERKRLEQKLARQRRALLEDDLVDEETAKAAIRKTQSELSALSAPTVYKAAGDTLTDLPALWPMMTDLERRNAAQSVLEAADVDLHAAEVVGFELKPEFRVLFPV